MVATRGQKRKQSDGEKKEEDKVPTPSGSVKNKTKNAENNNMMDVDEVKPVENEQEQLLLADVLNHCRIIEKAVSIREYRSMGRIVRELNTIRKKITPSVLKTVVATFCDTSLGLDKFLDKSEGKPVSLPAGYSKVHHLPECDAYIHLLLV